MERRIELAFATPRKLPKARELKGKVVVLDVAFASEAASGGFDKVTRPFIEALGPRLAGWVDHHDHAKHRDYANDPRFVLSTKQEHGACPEMVTPDVVARMGPVDTIVCHTDFDGLCSAAKWMRGGTEPYPGADDDARAIDTRIGKPSEIAERFDRAIRARSRDTALFGLIVRHLASGLSDAALWGPIDEAAAEGKALEDNARAIAQKYVLLDARYPPIRQLAFVDATSAGSSFDRTLLLLLGQERADAAMVLNGESLTLAAPYDSKISFLSILGLSGGMPTLVSVHKNRLLEALRALGVDSSDIERVVG